MSGFWWFLLWPIIGLLSAAWLSFVMRHGEPVEEITLGDAISTLGFACLGAAFGPLAFMFAISCTWDEFNLADITLWERKPLDLQKEAKKRGYELKPLKGMDD